jgi:hypothetical protein
MFLVAPSLVEVIIGKKANLKVYLVFACLSYFISWYVPSPLIEGKDTSFSTHVVGGGIVSGFLWLYLKSSLSVRLAWYQEAIGLFAMVSTLGVVNELFEFVIVKLGLVSRLSSADTWWDLVANTLGTAAFLLIYWLFSNSHGRRKEAKL